MTEIDKLVYAAGFGSQKTVKGEVIEVDPEHFAFQKAKLMLSSILENTHATDYRLYLTSDDKSNFRFKVAKTKGPKGQGYKAGRKGRPVHYAAIRNYLVQHWHAEVVTDMEADDKLAIELTRFGEEAICCSDDKDLLQVPGNHFIIRNSECRFITELDGWRNMYTQMLVGDTVDNIPGVSRIGPVKAARALKDCLSKDELDNIVRQIYLDNQLDRFDEIYNLVYLLREDDELNQYKTEEQEWQEDDVRERSRDMQKELK